MSSARIFYMLYVEFAYKDLLLQIKCIWTGPSEPRASEIYPDSSSVEVPIPDERQLGGSSGALGVSWLIVCSYEGGNDGGFQLDSVKS